MKKKYVFLALLLMSTIAASAQPGFDWLKNIGHGQPGFVENDAAGNLYVAGSFIGTMSFPSGDAITSTDIADESVFLVKLDSNGNEIWARKLPMTNTAIGYDPKWIAVNRIRIDQGTGRISVLGNLNYNGTDFLFFGLYQADGTFIGYDDSYLGGWPSDCAFDSLGNFYITGWSSAGTTQAYLLWKYDLSGNLKFVLNGTSGENVMPFNITIKSGAVWIAGAFQTWAHITDTLGTPPITLIGTTGNWNLFQAEFSLNGKLTGAWAYPATLPVPSHNFPSLSGDFSPSGNWTVGYPDYGSANGVQIDRYPLTLSGRTSVALKPAGGFPIINGTDGSESGVFSGWGAVGRVYSYGASGLMAASDSVPAATNSSDPIPPAPYIGISQNAAGSVNIAGSFTGSISYMGSLGAATLPSAASTYDIYVGKYHQCPVYSPTISQAGSVLLGSASGSGLTYQWFLNGVPIAGATSQIYTATTSGSYQVLVKDGWGCEGFSSPVSLTLGISTLTLADLEIFPNPATNTITINGLPENSQIEVDDMISRTRMQTTAKKMETTLDISTLQSGIYFLKTIAGTKRIVKL